MKVTTVARSSPSSSSSVSVGVGLPLRRRKRSIQSQTQSQTQSSWSGQGQEREKEVSKSITPDMIDTEWWHDLLHRLASSKHPALKQSQGNNFQSLFRVSRRTFEYICSLVEHDLATKPPSGLVGAEGRILTVEKQVAIALRRLASGDPQVLVGEQFGVGQSTVSQVTWRFVESMEVRGRCHLQWPGPQDMSRVKAGFAAATAGGLPNCCGAIGGTHVAMTLPSLESSADWLDRENKYSMVIQGIVDADMRFRDVLTGWPGCMDACEVLKNSGFYRLCQTGCRLNGKDLEDIHEYIVGSKAYPLLPWLITPYPDSHNQIQFNEKHALAVGIANKALSRLKQTWKILHRVMWRPDRSKLPRVILACCLLHNIIIDQREEEEDDFLESASLPPDCDNEGYAQTICPPSADALGLASRDALATHLLQP